MADYVSIYTGAQLDKMIMSGSSVSGKIIDNTLISGSILSTGSFAYLNVVGDAVIGGNLTIGDADTDSVSISADLTSNLIPNAAGTFDIGSSTKDWNYLFVNGISATDISASGNISASGDLYVGGLDIYGGATKRLTLGATNIFVGNVSGSSTSTGSFGTVHIGGDPYNGASSGLVFGDGDTGFYEHADDDVFFKRGGNTVFRANTSSQLDFGVSTLFYNSAGAFAIRANTAGDATAPNYSFKDDTDTGMYRVSADKLGFAAGGTLFLQITGSGLIVSGDISASGNIKANEFHTNVTSASITYASGSNKFGDTLDDVHRFTGSLEATSSTLTIDSVGGVSGSLTSTGSFGCIGIGNPTPTQNLVVGGNISASSHIFIQAGKAIYLNSPSLTEKIGYSTGPGGDYLEIKTSKVYVNATTGFGVNNENPVKALTVTGDISASGGFTLKSSASMGDLTAHTGSLDSINLSASGSALTFKGNISGSSLSTGSFGNVIVGHSIARAGDPDTNILFTDDDINITVGNINFMDFTQDTVSELTINESSQDLDVRIEGEADSKLFFTDASTSNVGIGTNTPTKKLTVSGSISASGVVHGSSFSATGSTGHITASGNISASGTSHKFGGITISNNDLIVGRHISLGGEISDGLNVGGAITASGDISGSIVSTGSFGRINFADMGTDATTGGNIVISASLQQTASVGHIIASNNSIQFGEGADAEVFNKSMVKNVRLGKRAKALTVPTLLDADLSPNIESGSVWKTTDDTTGVNVITAFEGGQAGDDLTLICQNTSTRTQGGAIGGNIRQDGTIACGTNDVFKYVYDGSNWFLVSYQDNSA